LGFVGAGKVSNTLARLFYGVDYPISAIYNRTPTRAKVLAEVVGAEVVEHISDVVRMSDLTIIAVADDALVEIDGAIPVENWEGKAVIHTSGVRNREALKHFEQCGALTGSLHPAFPFADGGLAPYDLKDVVFAVEASDERLREMLHTLVGAIGGHVFDISTDQKILYHAALVFASNYTVTLYSIAERILKRIGATGGLPSDILNPLMSGMLHNLKTRGAVSGLTGPLVRRDMRTIAEHVDRLTDMDEALAALYKQLAVQTLPLLAARNIDTHSIEVILGRSADYADDHS